MSISIKTSTRINGSTRIGSASGGGGSVPPSLEYLVVAGGAGGGARHGGGGGAGGLLSGSFAPAQGNSYTLTVGSGGWSYVRSVE